MNLVFIVVVDYDSEAWVEEVKNPKQYDPDHDENSDEVYGTASVAVWDNLPVVKDPFWKGMEIDETSTRHSEVQERYVRDKLKELKF